MTQEGIFLGQLEAFVEVARLGNVTRAADSLYITQPALSARLSRLEQSLGVQLLVRSRRGTRVTEAGRTFLPYATRALATIEEGRLTLRRHSAAHGGDLILGATPALATYVLPAIIKRLLELRPDASLGVRTAASEELVTLVLDGRVEIAVGRALHEPELESVPLFDEDLVLVVDPGHPIVRRSPVRVCDLVDEVMILFYRSAGYRDFAKVLMHQAGVAPRTVIDVDNSEVSKQMVRDGIGMTLLPRTAVAKDLSDGTLVEVRVSDLRPMRRPMVAFWRRGAPVPPLVPLLLDLLHSHFASGNLGRHAGARPDPP
jgi:LysR family hydrogen peroxide-inducible transcriptional activator